MKRLWKVGLGRHGEFESTALETSTLTVDFGVTTDLSAAKTREALVQVMATIHPDFLPKAHLNFAAQLNQFINVIQVGDIVVSPMKGTSTIAVGRVTGPYAPHPQTGKPTRPVTWLKADISRDSFKQDLLYSFGAFMTVCEVARNDALKRVEQVVATGVDPGDGAAPGAAPGAVVTKTTSAVAGGDQADSSDALIDLEQMARDQIEKRIASVFTGHDLSRLVAAILEAQGKKTRLSPPGADGGVDIVAGSGPLGLESPRIVVQVKSGNIVIDSPTLQSLIGAVHSTGADYGLMVSWGGFKSSVTAKMGELFFKVRFWGRREIVDNLLVVYSDLPETIRAELPLRRTWMLVPDEGEVG